MAGRGKLVLIDGNALVHRAWHALPPLQTKDGRLVNAVYGFLLVFFKVLKELKPTHLAVAFDRQEPTFRHQAYAAYKATRQKQAQELYDQIPILKDVLAALRVPVCEKAGYEADDVIGTLAENAKHSHFATVIVTGDLDTLQLVDASTSVYTLRRGLTDTTTYDETAVRERYGLPPAQLVEYRALRGDPSDNLPGVKGIGEKTAAELIQAFGTLEKLYHAVDAKGPTRPPLTERVRELLRVRRDDAFMTRTLSLIQTNVPLAVSFDDLTTREADTDRVVELFQELQFKSLLAKLPAASHAASSAADTTRQHSRSSYVLVADEAAARELVQLLARERVVAIDTETTSLNPLDADLVGMSMSWREGTAYYVALAQTPELLTFFKPFLEDEQVKKWGHNIKYDLRVLARAGVALAGVIGDTMVADYLLHPGSRAHDLDTLAFTEFGHRKIPITRLIGAGREQRSMRDVPVAEVTDYACEDADYTWRLSQRLLSELKRHDLRSLFDTIEIPTIAVLAAMETNGIKVDAPVLQRLSRRLGTRLQSLEKKIHHVAGRTFNVASPRQLADVLFVTLGLPTAGIGKTKSGYSTAAAELEKMRGAHPVIEAVLAYRELAKVKSTYLDALPALIHPKTGRVHTSFNQTVTATGRLSSSDPNLQNIPIHGELGTAVRNAFIAERGHVLVSADYSQIELRIIASLAEDATMLDIFRRGEDVHTATAAAIHGIPEATVTKAIRHTAKEVNFGVIYGMGPWGLAARTGMSTDEARDFIDRYFATFSGIKRYLDEVMALAKKLGYAETLFGRRRYLPELSSGVAQVRQAGERMAVNMPIQGTAADLMKLAMVAVHRTLPLVSPAARLVLQVHDELVVEVPRADVAKVGHLLSDEMVSVAKMKAPVEVHVASGTRWGALKVLTP